MARAKKGALPAEAAELRRQYMRSYYAQNRDRYRKYAADYWSKKAEEFHAARRAEKEEASHE